MKLKGLLKQAKRQNASKRRKELLLAITESKSSNEIAANIRLASDGFLLSREWKELRELAIGKYGTKCMRCGCVPRNPRNVNVDHIKPRKFHPDLALEFENLQILCSPCNKTKGNKHETDYRPHPLGNLWEKHGG